MLFGKYHIVIFREGKSGSRSLRVRGWLAPFFCVLVLALVVANVWLLQRFLESVHLEESLSDVSRSLEDERQRFMQLTERVTEVGDDLERVRRFDDKLRIMMHMESDPAEVGEEEREDFSHVYLPLHRQELAARRMRDFLDRLSHAARLEEVKQQDLLLALRENREILSVTPSIWPVTGFVSSGFGWRAALFGGGGGHFHKGLDISNQVGTTIVAPAQGKVTMAGPDGAYGNSVEIDHGAGIVTKYGHMQRCAVTVGTWVKRGEVIGYIGTTGRTTGPHLHYEVHLNGVPVDPMRYILQ